MGGVRVRVRNPCLYLLDRYKFLLRVGGPSMFSRATYLPFLLFGDDGSLFSLAAAAALASALLGSSPPIPATTHPSAKKKKRGMSGCQIHVDDNMYISLSASPPCSDSIYVALEPRLTTMQSTPWRPHSLAPALSSAWLQNCTICIDQVCLLNT